MFVHECMNREFSVLQPDSTMRDALLLFRRDKTGIIPIVDADRKLSAVITQYALFQAILDNYSLNNVITPYIINKVVTVYEDDTLDYAREFLIQNRVVHAIVISRDNHVCGILGRADIIRTSRFLIQTSRVRNEALTNSLDSLIQNMPTGVLATDQQGTIQVMNKAAESMCSLSIDSAIGEHISSVLPELNQVIASIESNQDVQPQKIIIRKRKLLINATSLSKGEQLWGGLIIFQDFTDYENMASELESTKKLEQTLKTVIDSAYDGLILIDEQGIIRMVNEGISHLTTHTKQEMIGQSAKEFFPELKLEKALMGDVKNNNIEAITMGGHRSLVTKIPILRHQKTVGAIAKITYRNLNKWKNVIKSLDNLKKEVSYYRGELSRLEGKPFDLDDILTQNEGMKQIIRTARQSASGFSNILLLGESGTGKGLFARGIHNASGRPGRLVTINCAAVPADLWEAEFFGYEEGAFTGAKRGGKPGKFELANDGTLFLDEIGDMPLAMQAKLLRVLQEREFERVGGTKTIQVNVRILAATNKNLEQMVVDGKFREDLYYRLNVIPLYIPPLRMRKDDIPILTTAISNKFSHLMDMGPITIHKDAMNLLSSYDWPGNIRELENVIERAMNSMNGDVLETEHLSDFLANKNMLYHERRDSLGTFSLVNEQPMNQIGAEKPISTYKSKVTEAEKEAIVTALQSTEGNRTAAAKILGISRSQLYKKLNQYSIQ